MLGSIHPQPRLQMISASSTSLGMSGLCEDMVRVSRVRRRTYYATHQSHQAVDLYGNMANMKALRAVAQRHNLKLIDDAAEAVGSEFGGRKAGSLGDTGVSSFHGSKMLTTGEGGLLATDDSNVYERVMVLRDHGRQPGDTMFFNAEVGYKYKMSSMQAALGLAQLERVEELVARKREISTGIARNCTTRRDLF